MDFNGALSFWDDSFHKALISASALGKIKGVFVMGGVWSNALPQTMSISPVINRFSGATMNQLYHPVNTAHFFSFLDSHRTIPVWTISNNIVDPMYSPDDNSDKLDPRKLKLFLDGAGISGSFLLAFSTTYYDAPTGFPSLHGNHTSWKSHVSLKYRA